MALLTQSYVHGVSSTPLIGETIGQLLRRVTAEGSERPALVTRHQNVRWTYADLLRRSEDLAVGLRKLGLEKGDRVGIWSANVSEWVLAQFGTALAGIILVNINPAYRSHEFDYAIKKSSCRALILSPGHKNNDYFASLRTCAPEIDAAEPGKLQSKGLPKLEFVIRLGADKSPGMLNFDDVAKPATAGERAELMAFEAALQFDDPINIQFTSGTTGAPKGATLTHHNILNNGYFIGEAMRLTPEDRLCIPVPYYHCFGMVLGNLACVTHGSCMVSPSEGFDPIATMEAVQAERCTGLHGVPTMFIAMLEHAEFARFDLKSLRTGIMAGSPCPVEVMRKVVNAMHMSEVTIAYGMTETSPVSFQSAYNDPLERRVSTVGRILPHLEVKIVDAEGRIVPPGVAGELLTRGYSVMRGYWDDPAATAASIDGARFMHTGDLATIDRGRLLQYCRPAEGHGHSRRRERLSARNRGISLHPPGGRRGPGLRRSRSSLWRGAMRLGSPPRGFSVERGRDYRLLPGANRPLQGSALRALRRFVPDDGHRQGSKVFDAQDDDGGTGPGRRKDGMKPCGSVTSE